MSLFEQEILINEVGTYVMPYIFCKKVDVLYGFKAYGEDLKTTETLTSGANSLSTKVAEIGIRMEDEPGLLCPEKRGFHFCKKLSEVLRNRPIEGKKNKKFRYFYCKTGEVCVAEKFALWRTNSIVTNAITPLFEIDFREYEGDINNSHQIDCFAESQVQEYWKKRKAEKTIEDRKRSSEERPYKCIPLYTEEEMKNAEIVSDDEVIKKYIGRQALNGYVGLYKGKWVVGRNKHGEIVKTKENLLFETFQTDIEKRNRRISYTQNHALYGEDLVGEIFCKFTYDKKFQKDYAIHVELVKEYAEAEVVEDGGAYGGIHFVPLGHIELCLDSRNTYYGNKIAFIEPIENEIYYEYMENVFAGKKVYVSKVMNLYEVETWRVLSEMTSIIKEKKDVVCAYLKGLEDEIGHESYGECIDFVSKL
ncbi:MAG: hypothetical protein ACI4E2_00515 [Acetatifactor sp.]